MSKERHTDGELRAPSRAISALMALALLAALALGADETPRLLGSPLFYADVYGWEAPELPLAAVTDAPLASAPTPAVAPEAPALPPPVKIPPASALPAAAWWTLFCLALFAALCLSWRAVCHWLTSCRLWLLLRRRDASPEELVPLARQLHHAPPGATVQELLRGPAARNHRLSQRLKDYENGFSPR